MWTFESTGRSARSRRAMRALEALSLAIAFAFLPELPWVSHGLVLEPHPGWLAVLVLSARYGSGGFFAGLTSCALAVCAALSIAGTGLPDAWGRLDSDLNLMALGACLIVAWIASCHSRRQTDLGERLRVLSDRAADAAPRRLREDSEPWLRPPRSCVRGSIGPRPR